MGQKSSSFKGQFAQLRVPPPASSCLSVSLSVRMHQLVLIFQGVKVAGVPLRFGQTHNPTTLSVFFLFS